MPMTAKVNDNDVSNFDTRHRREKHYYKSMVAVALVDGNIKTVVDMRFYSTPGSDSVCVWVNGDYFTNNGSGSSGGYALHRPSAAAQQALRNAGVELSGTISGRGDDSIRDALVAVALAVYPDASDVKVLETHG